MFKTEIPQFANTRAEKSLHQYLNKNFTSTQPWSYVQRPWNAPHQAKMLTLSTQCLYSSLWAFWAMLYKGKKNKRKRKKPHNQDRWTRWKPRQCAEWWNPKAHFHSRSQTGTGRQTNCYQRDLWWTCNSTSDLYFKWQLECHLRKKKKERKKEKSRHQESCNRKLLLATICSSTRFFFVFMPTQRAPIGKQGRSP